MGAVVSLLKNAVLALLFIGLVVGIAAIALVSSGPAPVEQKLIVIAVVVAAEICLFLAVASTAVVLSIHDRHNEIAEGVHRIAQAIEGSSNRGGDNVG